MAEANLIHTPDQRVRVFVSSALRELAAERQAVRDAIAGLRLVPVMFELGARPHPPRNVYRAYLDQSQIFVGIYWQSYGWAAPGDRVSGLDRSSPQRSARWAVYLGFRDARAGLLTTRPRGGG
jgi:hypothetical protein